MPTTIWSAAGLMLEQGAFGVRYILLAPVSAIAVSEDVILRRRVGLQPELGKNIGFAAIVQSRFRLPSAAPPCHNKNLSQYLFLF